MSRTSTFRALVLEAPDGEAPSADWRDLDPGQLPAGEVRIAVAYSSLNYKDGLAVTGRGKVIRRFPMVPGIDLAGTVVESTEPRFQPGEPVLVTGCGLGETHWGGYAEQACVPGEWVVPLPAGLTLERAMAIGTAGFTAMLCLMELEEHGLRPGAGDVLVTGAGGGVGSIAVALLAALGYRVVAATGRAELHGDLQELGAAEVIARAALDREAKALESQRWVGAIDSVGGRTLATVLAQMHARAPVAACGNVAGASLETTVFPFILRAIALLGVASASCPYDRRIAAWQRLAQELPQRQLAALYRVEPLAEVPRLAEEILAGRIRGRTVIDVASTRQPQ